MTGLHVTIMLYDKVSQKKSKNPKILDIRNHLWYMCNMKSSMDKFICYYTNHIIPLSEIIPKFWIYKLWLSEHFAPRSEERKDMQICSLV